MWALPVDEDMPRSTVVMLRQAGHTAEDVRDVGLRGHNDDDVFAYAQATQAILVTADKGFANVLSYPPGTHAGLIVVRVPEHRGHDDLLNAAALVVQAATLGRLRAAEGRRRTSASCC